MGTAVAVGAGCAGAVVEEDGADGLRVAREEVGEAVAGLVTSELVSRRKVYVLETGRCEGVDWNAEGGESK